MCLFCEYIVKYKTEIIIAFSWILFCRFSECYLIWRNITCPWSQKMQFLCYSVWKIPTITVVYVVHILYLCEELRVTTNKGWCLIKVNKCEIPLCPESDCFVWSSQCRVLNCYCCLKGSRIGNIMEDSDCLFMVSPSE
jgi:hypothetical protein